ncbi:MAG: glutamine synthetase family protein [Candidatus Njordarchaeum guaymaensis]
MKSEELAITLQKSGVKFIALQITDLMGQLKGFEYPIRHLSKILRNGVRADGSSLGFSKVERSDILIMPDVDTLHILPWNKNIVRVFGNILTLEGKPYESDPRGILKKVLEEGEKSGFKFNVGPEPEFYLFDKDGMFIDKSTYADVDPYDKGMEFRRALSEILLELDIEPDVHHHEVGPGQNEIELKKDVEALKQADNLQKFKHIAKVLGAKMGFIVSFMPKPEINIAGNGMHLHLSILDKETGENLVVDKNLTLTDLAKNFIAGILNHAKGITAIVAPTVNSYKRLKPGYEAPVYICWGEFNRTAMIRIPAFKSRSSATIEYRTPDPMANPYLAFAVVIAAGLEGIKHNLEPPKPINMNTYKMNAEERNKLGIEMLPGNLYDAIQEMRKDPLISKVLGAKTMEIFAEKLLKDWNDYKEHVEDPYELKVTDWEKRRYMFL